MKESDLPENVRERNGRGRRLLEDGGRDGSVCLDSCGESGDDVTEEDSVVDRVAVSSPRSLVDEVAGVASLARPRNDNALKESDRAPRKAPRLREGARDCCFCGVLFESSSS